MPEIKQNFTRGVMNKDLDKRVVPNGQIEHGVNIEVNTSDQSSSEAGLGLITNVKGNVSIEDLMPGGEFKTIASVSDEKNNKIYWFVSGFDKDFICEYSVDVNNAILILVDVNKLNEKAFLKFQNNKITGVNIVDDFLIWTDNNSEPKKINIQRCKEGSSDIDTSTRLIVDGIDKGELSEDHITLIKKKPLAPPTIKINTLEERKASEPILERIFPRFALRYKYADNEYSAIGPFTEVVFNPLLKEPYTISTAYSRVEGYNLAMENAIDSLDILDFVPKSIPEDVVQVDILYKQENSSVVYSVASIRYDDPEWSEIGSAADAWSGYGEAEITGFDKGRYNISSENVYAALPENQVLRSYDNVPRKALAQEITGNRLVLANYVQNYDIVETPKVTAQYESKNYFQTSLYRGDASLKSKRQYQLGVVFGDKYGRETPVFSSTDSSFKVPFIDNNVGGIVSLSPIQACASLQSQVPDWADYYKYYIKETSSEYYNILIDKAYDPATYEGFDNEEGHIWVSMNSFDVNKINEDDYITLKKIINNNISEPVPIENRYKVLSKQTEGVPDSIKFVFHSYGFISNAGVDASLTNIFTDETHNIGSETQKIILDKSQWLAAGGSPLENYMFNIASLEAERIYISWRLSTGGANQASKRYEATAFSFQDGDYIITLKDTISLADANLASDGAGGIDTNLQFNIQKKVEKEIEEFSGKFFVKIVADETVTNNLLQVDFDIEETFSFSSQQTFHWLADDRVLISGENISETDGVFDVADYTTDPDTLAVTTAEGEGAVDTPTEWETLLNNVSSRFFVDSMTCVAGQSSPDNYAFSSGPAFYGNYTRFEEVQYAGSPTNENPDPFGYLNSPWRGFTSTAGINNTDATSGLYWKNRVANGLRGIITSDDYTIGQPGGDVILPGSRRWRSSNIYAESPAAMVDDTYGNTPGKIFLHVSFLAPGQNLHDGDWGDAGTGLENTNVDRQNGIANYMQGIWGGGVFTKYDGTPFSPSWVSAEDSPGFAQRFIEFESNWNQYTPNDPQPAPGVGIGYDQEYSDRHNNQWNPLATADGDPTGEIAEFLNNLAPGNQFRFKQGDSEFNTTYTIASVTQKKLYNHTPWRARKIWNQNEVSETLYSEDYTATAPAVKFAGDSVEEAAVEWAKEVFSAGTADFDSDEAIAKGQILKQRIQNFGAAHNRRVCYVLELDINPSGDSSDFDPIAGGSNNPDSVNTFDIQMIGGSSLLTGAIIKNPAVAEVLPKTQEGLNIYYEADRAIPLNINEKTSSTFAPVGSKVEFVNLPSAINGTRVIDYDLYLKNYFYEEDGTVGINVSSNDSTLGFNLNDSEGVEIQYVNSKIKFIRPDGGYTIASVISHLYVEEEAEEESVSRFLINPVVDPSDKTGLNWSNCFVFGDGVESDRVRDDFNEMSMSNGAKASTTIEEDYQEERRGNGLIYSGIYNPSTSINRFNEFITAEKITKDLNPTYGSIQKLFSRNTDLISFCEDRVIKILANKDAVFNADGNPQLVASPNVLGQAVAFVGDYGISKNPESFASESYRAYFADKQRGVILRLSMDGITPISDFGMRSYFRDNLRNYTDILGTYDEYKKEYNVHLSSAESGNIILNSFISEGVQPALSFLNEEYVVNTELTQGSNLTLSNLTTFYNTFGGLVENPAFGTSYYFTHQDEIPAGSIQEFEEAQEDPGQGIGFEQSGWIGYQLSATDPLQISENGGAGVAFNLNMDSEGFDTPIETDGLLTGSGSTIMGGSNSHENSFLANLNYNAGDGSVTDSISGSVKYAINNRGLIGFNYWTIRNYYDNNDNINDWGETQTWISFPHPLASIGLDLMEIVSADALDPANNVPENVSNVDLDSNNMTIYAGEEIQVALDLDLYMQSTGQSWHLGYYGEGACAGKIIIQMYDGDTPISDDLIYVPSSIPLGPLFDQTEFLPYASVGTNLGTDGTVEPYEANQLFTYSQQTGSSSGYTIGSGSTLSESSLATFGGPQFDPSTTRGFVSTNTVIFDRPCSSEEWDASEDVTYQGTGYKAGLNRGPNVYSFFVKFKPQGEDIEQQQLEINDATGPGGTWSLENQTGNDMSGEEAGGINNWVNFSSTPVVENFNIRIKPVIEYDTTAAGYNPSLYGMSNWVLHQVGVRNVAIHKTYKATSIYQAPFFLDNSVPAIPETTIPEFTHVSALPSITGWLPLNNALAVDGQGSTITNLFNIEPTPLSNPMSTVSGSTIDGDSYEYFDFTSGIYPEPFPVDVETGVQSLGGSNTTVHFQSTTDGTAANTTDVVLSNTLIQPMQENHWYMVEAAYDLNDQEDGYFSGIENNNGLYIKGCIRHIEGGVQNADDFAAGYLNSQLEDYDTAFFTDQSDHHKLYPDGSYGMIGGNPRVKGIKHLFLREAIADEYSPTDLPYNTNQTVHRAIFKFDAGSAIGGSMFWNNGAGALSSSISDGAQNLKIVSRGQNFKYKSIQVVDITDTVSGGDIQAPWVKSSNAPKYQHGFDNYSQSLYFHSGAFNWNIPDNEGFNSANPSDHIIKNKSLLQDHSTGTAEFPEITANTSGYHLEFVMQPEYFSNTFSGSALLNVYNHEAVSASTGKGISISNIDMPGLYKFKYNYDETFPELLEAPEGSNVVFDSSMISTPGGNTGQSKIVMRPQGGGGHFIGALTRMSIIDITPIIDGGGIDNWTIEGAIVGEQIFFNDGQITFDGAPDESYIFQGLGYLEQGQEYNISFTFNNLESGQDSITVSYHNSNGFGGVLNLEDYIVPTSAAGFDGSSGTFSGSFVIGSSETPDENLPLNSIVISVNGEATVNIDNITMQEVIGGGLNFVEPQTITFNEEAKGWVSFKDYHPDHGSSVASKYFTFKGSKIYEHYHVLSEINSWYNNDFKNSSVRFFVNADPSTVKNFEYASYEGSQAFAIATETTPEQLGWQMTSLETELDKGEAYLGHSFKKKEGKWFNYIKRVEGYHNLSSTETSNWQGLGEVLSSTIIG